MKGSKGALQRGLCCQKHCLPGQDFSQQAAGSLFPMNGSTQMSNQSHRRLCKQSLAGRLHPGLLKANMQEFCVLSGTGNPLCLLFSSLPSCTRQGRTCCTKHTLQIPNSISKHIYTPQDRPLNMLELLLSQNFGSKGGRFSKGLSKLMPPKALQTEPLDMTSNSLYCSTTLEQAC